jgi:hypothetical protein
VGAVVTGVSVVSIVLVTIDVTAAAKAKKELKRQGILLAGVGYGKRLFAIIFEV